MNTEMRDEIEREEEINKKQEHRIRNLEAKAVQNVNLYFIFQAVILASTTLSSSTSCRNSWIPIALSLVAAVTNFLSFFAGLSKILKSREELDQSLSDLAFIKLHKLRREQINQATPGAAFNHLGGEIVRPDAGSFKKRRRHVVAYVCIGLFGGFSGMVMYGCHRILCHPGETKCVKLC